MEALSTPTPPFTFDITGPRPVLLVDDDDDSILLLQLLLKRAGVNNPICITTDGDQAVTHLRTYLEDPARPLPLIVFLDLKLPRLNGFEVLKWIRAQPEFARLPVMIMSSSNHPRDLETARSLGADFYCGKYPEHEQLAALFAGEKTFPSPPTLDFG